MLKFIIFFFLDSILTSLQAIPVLMITQFMVLDRQFFFNDNTVHGIGQTVFPYGNY